MKKKNNYYKKTKDYRKKINKCHKKLLLLFYFIKLYRNNFNNLFNNI